MLVRALLTHQGAFLAVSQVKSANMAVRSRVRTNSRKAKAVHDRVCKEAEARENPAR